MSDRREPDETPAAGAAGQTTDEELLLEEEFDDLEDLSAEELEQIATADESNMYEGLEEYREDELADVDLEIDWDDDELDAQLAEFISDDELADLDLDAAPVDIDDEWRDAELEKMMIGVGQGKSGSSKFLFVAIFILFVAFLGWTVFAPAGDAAEAQLAAADLTQLDPGPPKPPPPPPPPPKPYKDVFELQTGFDGQQYIAYTIQPDDDLQTIGEKLHDVTGAPRPVTYLAVEDAYWRKYFSYEEQNADVVSFEQVQTHVGETIQIPVPVPEFPDFDLAAQVEEYNS